EAPALDLQVPGQAGGGRKGFLDFEALLVRNGEEDVAAEIRIDDGAERQLDLLGREAHRLLAFLAAEDRIVAVRELQRPALVAAGRVEDGADVGVQRLCAAEERRRRRRAACRGRRRRRGLRRLPLSRRRGSVLAQRLLQFAAQRLFVLARIGCAG